MPVSAAVMVTGKPRNTDAGDVLELLVLWRGTPGWFAKGGRSGSSGGSSERGWRHRFADGGYEFEITGDSAGGAAAILGRTIDLKEANVVFVDGVDSQTGPVIVGTLMIDGKLDGGPEQGPNRILRLLGRVPPLREYLRCETSLPNPAMQARLAPMCALVLAQ